MHKTDYINPDQCGSLSDLFLQRVSRSSNDIAYRFWDAPNNRFSSISWKNIFHEVVRWRQGLIREDLAPGDRVALMLGNGIQWVIFEHAALSLGLVVVPLYVNDRSDNIAYILEHTEARLLLCSGQTCCDQISHHLGKLPDLRCIITLNPAATDDGNTIFIAADNWLEPAEATPTSYEPLFHDIATIVYTSGTTGPPKGVMLSHNNILTNAYAGLKCVEIMVQDTFLSFLPLSHMLERTAGYYLPMMAGATVAYARSIPDLPEDLVSLKPTVLVAVPRIFERVYSKIVTGLAAKPPFTQKLFHHALETGWKHFLHAQGRGNWEISLLAQPFLDKLVGQKVRDRLGGKLRIVITGGAPFSTDIAKFFIGLGLPIYQGYGLTETSPVVSVNRIEDNRPEGVGLPLPGVEVRIGEAEELLVRGECVMRGYWRNPEATAATVDGEGWLHTGDRAVLEDNHIRITGRLKEIIVLSNGEKVPPADMEMAITADPLFEQVLIIGEGRPYLTLLAVLNTPLWQELAGELGVPADEESLQLVPVQRALLDRVDGLLQNFPGYAFIKEIGPTLSPWTVEKGLLTPTLKLKRAVIVSHMQQQIDRMYEKIKVE